mmetsp:Transcript_105331/g.274158  ORF Transcript_105331/g.274158 Transcript_105331/m.274158 type:complete len:218 (+) Transcript_105331:137-790(+)
MDIASLMVHSAKHVLSVVGAQVVLWWREESGRRVPKTTVEQQLHEGHHEVHHHAKVGRLRELLDPRRHAARRCGRDLAERDPRERHRRHREVVLAHLPCFAEHRGHFDGDLPSEPHSPPGRLDWEYFALKFWESGSSIAVPLILSTVPLAVRLCPHRWPSRTGEPGGRSERLHGQSDQSDQRWRVCGQGAALNSIVRLCPDPWKDPSCAYPHQHRRV